MKIFIINPDYGMTKAEMDERCATLKTYLAPDTELVMDCLHTNEVYIDSALDVVLAGSEIVSMAKKAEESGFDAVVIYCLSDPAIDACREILSIPVIGGGQASYLTALTVGRHFGLIVTEKNRIPEKKLFVHQTGVAAERVSSISAVDLGGLGIRQDINHTLKCLERTANAMIANEGAEVIVLGCLSFLGIAESLSNLIGIPVIDSAAAAVGLAEFTARQRLLNSKKSWAVPPKGSRSWQSGKFTI